LEERENSLEKYVINYWLGLQETFGWAGAAVLRSSSLGLQATDMKLALAKDSEAVMTAVWRRTS
jgi:hypothetical protein